MTKTQLERLQDMTLKEFLTAQEDPDEYVTVDTLTADIDEIETMVDMVKRDIENLLHNVPK